MKKYINTTILSLLFISIWLNISSFTFIFNQESKIKSVKEFMEGKKSEYLNLWNDKIIQEIADNKIKEINKWIQDMASLNWSWTEIKYNIVDLSDVYSKFYQWVKLYWFETKDNQTVLDRMKGQMYSTEIKIWDVSFTDWGIPEHLKTLCQNYWFSYCLTFKTIEGWNTFYTKTELSWIPSKNDISEIIKEMKSDETKWLSYINLKLSTNVLSNTPIIQKSINNNDSSNIQNVNPSIRMWN